MSRGTAFQICPYLPSGWSRVEMDGGGRWYRSCEGRGGLLHLSVAPPLTQGSVPSEKVVAAAVDQLLVASTCERTISEMNVENSVGRFHAKVYIHRKHGAVMAGMSAGPLATIVGSFERPSPDGPAEDMTEALDIFVHAELRTFDVK